MGSASSKKNQGLVTCSGEPGVVEIHTVGPGKGVTVEGYVNSIAERNERKDIKNTSVDTSVKCSKTSATNRNNDALINTWVKGVGGKNTVKSISNWDKYSRRESRLRSREKCLVGLENIRRTASPQLLMASRENYGRIKDASDLLRLQPSETDVADTKPIIDGPLDSADDLVVTDITNQNIFREVSDIHLKGKDLPKCGKDSNKDQRKQSPSRSPKRHGVEKPYKDMSPTRSKRDLNVSPPWLKSDLKGSFTSQKRMPEDLSGILHDQRARSRDSSLDRCQGSDGKSSLGPLRYGKLGMQGGAIRKELEKEGILGVASDDKKNPDVVLRELRQMGLVKQTDSGTSYSLHIEDSQNRAARASRLPPLEFDALCRKIEEKEKRHQEQVEKIVTERQEKSQKFKERHKSAKTRRQQLQQQRPEQGEAEAEAERLKMKMLDMDLL